MRCEETDSWKLGKKLTLFFTCKNVRRNSLVPWLSSNPITPSCLYYSQLTINFIPGKCDCYPGWSGLNCTEQCSDNSYGIKCESTCNCKNKAKCHPTNGYCTCQPGYYGHTCSKGSFEFFYEQHEKLRFRKTNENFNATLHATPRRMVNEVTRSQWIKNHVALKQTL